MTNLRDQGKRLGLLCGVSALGIALLIPVAAWAQRGNNANGRGNGNAVPDLQQGPINLPPIPPQGAWGEVIMASDKWLVVQNHQGQQFPIAMDAVNQFLIRWPTSIDALGPEYVVEAIGPDVGNNTLQTDHIDVFAGGDRTLVAPTYIRLLPNNRPDTTIDPTFNRFMNGWDIGAQNLLYGWAYPVAPGQLGIPARLHVVGNFIPNPNAVLVGIPGNNFASVMPANPGNFAITQITRGSSSFADKGDLVYLMPVNLTPRTVVLTQLVLYKKVSLAEYRAR
jgi:hypothetical protein